MAQKMADLIAQKKQAIQEMKSSELMGRCMCATQCGSRAEEVAVLSGAAVVSIVVDQLIPGSSVIGSILTVVGAGVGTLGMYGTARSAVVARHEWRELASRAVKAVKPVAKEADFFAERTNLSSVQVEALRAIKK